MKKFRIKGTKNVVSVGSDFTHYDKINCGFGTIVIPVKEILTPMNLRKFLANGILEEIPEENPAKPKYSFTLNDVFSFEANRKHIQLEHFIRSFVAVNEVCKTAILAALIKMCSDYALYYLKVEDKGTTYYIVNSECDIEKYPSDELESSLGEEAPFYSREVVDYVVRNILHTQIASIHASN